MMMIMMMMTIVITIMIIIITIIVITIITSKNFTAVRRRITDQILSLKGQHKGSTYRVKKENSGSCRQVQSNTSSLQRQQHHCR